MNTVQASRPWYREPWTWGLMAGPFIVIIAGVITAWLALNKHPNDMVVDDYYKEGLIINKQIAREQNALKSGISINLMLVDEQGLTMRALMKADEGVLLPSTIKLNLNHPTRANQDQKIILTRDQQGIYTGKLSEAISGKRHVELLSPDDAWRVVGVWNVTPRSAILLGARPEDQSNVN